MMDISNADIKEISEYKKSYTNIVKFVFIFMLNLKKIFFWI